MPRDPKKSRIDSSTKEFERTIASDGRMHYVLCLYVTGMTPKSRRAISNLKKICEEELAGRYDLEVIDIYQNPTLAESEQIVAAPTLIKKLPAPMRKFIGDLADREKILLGLDIRRKAEE